GVGAVGWGRSNCKGRGAPRGAWASYMWPERVADWSPTWLDDLCTAGRIAWTRLRPPASEAGGGSAPVRGTPVALLPRRDFATWVQASAAKQDDGPALSSRAGKVDRKSTRLNSSHVKISY